MIVNHRWGKVRTISRCALLSAMAVYASGCAVTAKHSWLQWGGPDRNFKCETSTKLATQWPKQGPRKLWTREIGDGYSAILVEDGVLYTMCRRDDKDAVIALDAATGKTRWETTYHSPMEGMNLDFGPGPLSTPLIVGDHLITIGATMKLHCLDKKTGRIVWSHDLVAEMGAKPQRRGYGASPVAYKDKVILPVGGEDQGIVAFNLADGKVAWKSQSYQAGYSSPLIVNMHGRDMLVLATGVTRAGLDPNDGSLLWETKVDKQSAAAISSPLLAGKDIVFFSTANGGGSRAFKISQQDGKFEATELWHYRKMQVHHGNAILIGDHIYGSTGDFGPAFVIAVNVNTGKAAWRKRGFAKANFLYAGGKLVILDENGELAIATATPEGLEIHAQAKLLENQAWTVPTLVNTHLFLRDRKTIMAVDLAG